MAESEGFEPPEGFPSTVFKTAAFDHSASSPGLYKFLRYFRNKLDDFILSLRSRLSGKVT